MLAAMAMLFAGLGATCDALCCPLAPAQSSMHAAMPCCAGTASMSRSESTRLPAATTTAQVQTPAPAKAVVTIATNTAPMRVTSHRSAPSPAHHEPSPPLFLRNAQLLI
jgi:hypothetical protein